nr:immunoglobulin light chain junction region [Macaca mulatta]
DYYCCSYTTNTTFVF